MKRYLMLIIIGITLFLLFACFLSCQGHKHNPSNGGLIDTIPVPPRSVHDTYPIWSSVHNLIAYIHHWEKDSLNDERARGIHLINPDGTNDRFFHDGGGALTWFNLDWAPDGSCLLVRNQFGLFTISYPDKEITMLRSNIDPMSFSYLNAAFSPDGDKIRFENKGGDDRGTYLMNCDGSGEHLVIHYGVKAVWAAHDSIVYINYDPELPSGSICIADTSGTFKRVVYNNDGLFAANDFSAAIHIPTRKMAVYGPYFEDRYPADLGKMEPDWQQIVLLVYDAEYPCFSPDGSQVVFTYEKPGFGGLHIINWDGTNQRQLTE